MNANEHRLERVTSILPCADLPLTLATLAEYILTDIWVRFRKQDGRPVLRGYIDDALDASRSPETDNRKKDAAAAEAVRRPRTLKLFQLEGDAVSAAGDFTAGASVRGPGALHMFSPDGLGPGLNAETYLRHLDPSALRYNVAASFHGVPADMHIAPELFRSRYNRDVVELFAGVFAKLGGAEALGHADKSADDLNGTKIQDGSVLGRAAAENLKLARDAYEAWDYAGVVELARTTARDIHAFMDRHGALISRQSPERGAALGSARVLAAMLAPILPVFAAGVKELLSLTADPAFTDTGEPPSEDHACCTYRPLAAFVEERDMADMFAEASVNASDEDNEPPRDVGLISPDELGRVELRAGLVVSANLVDGADKLLRLEIDFGEERPRPVLAGLREAYAPSELEGLTLLCVTNLPPRETRFGVSAAMILAAGDPPVVFTAHRAVAPGERLR